MSDWDSIYSLIDSALKMQRLLNLLSEANKDLEKYKLLVYCDDPDEVLRQINMLIEPNIPAGPVVIHQKTKDRGLWQLL